MSKDPRVFIEHILESIYLVQTYVAQVSKEDFLASSQLQDAVVRRIEIIGEAVKNLPEELRGRYPAVPWARNRGNERCPDSRVLRCRPGTDMENRGARFAGTGAHAVEYS